MGGHIAVPGEHLGGSVMKALNRDTHTHAGRQAFSQPKFSISLPLQLGKLLPSYKAADCYFCSLVHGEENINERSECRIVLKTKTKKKLIA